MGFAPGTNRALSAGEPVSGSFEVKSPQLVTCCLSIVVAFAAGCETKAARSSEAQPPNDEVWMTRAQVHDAHVELEPVMARPVGNEVITSGKVAFDDLRVSHVFSPVTGRVTRILADPGERVKEGAPLAIIESPDVGNAFADLAKAQADLIAAEHDFRRQQELYAAHAGSQRDFESADDNYRKARAEMERARKKAALFRKSASDDVTQGFTLRAPIAGQVVARNVNPGIEVQGQYSGGTAVELFTIGELDSVWVLADVFEMDIGRVHRGAPVTVRVVAYPNEVFSGHLDYITDALDPTTRTARVRCSIANPAHKLKAEMYATVSIGVEGRPVPAVSRSAVLHIAEQSVVFVENGTAPDGRLRFVRKVVAVDESDGADYVPVLRGLRPGDRVVSAGGILLSGML
jgi:cobalt-zinc-cadmium efflux system membrane fusion protein